MFVRIKENGYDINGNHLFRVFAYKEMEKEHLNLIGQYRPIGRNEAKNLLSFGKINKDNSCTTQLYKNEILQRLKEKARTLYINENVLFVFE